VAQAASADPGEGALDDAAAREHLEGLDAFGFAHDLEQQP
jgi:hypothetical protein